MFAPQLGDLTRRFLPTGSGKHGKAHNDILDVSHHFTLLPHTQNFRRNRILGHLRIMSLILL